MIRSEQCAHRMKYTQDAWHLQRFLRYSSPAAFAIAEWWTAGELNAIWDRHKYKNCPSITWTQQSLLAAAEGLNDGKPYRLVIRRRECWDGVSFMFQRARLKQFVSSEDMNTRQIGLA